MVTKAKAALTIRQSVGQIRAALGGNFSRSGKTSAGLTALLKLAEELLEDDKEQTVERATDLRS